MKLLRIALIVCTFLSISLSAFSQSTPAKSTDKKPNNVPSDVYTLTKIHTIHMTVSAENWEKMQPPQRGGFGGGFGPPGGMPANPGNPPPGGGDVLVGPPIGGPQGGPPGRMGFEFDYVHGSVEVDGQTFKDAAVRFKGNASYMSSQRGLKRPFKIDLNKFEKNAQFNGVTTLVLNNNVMDASMMRETIAYPLFRAAGLPASRTGYAKVYLTVPGKHAREYVGLYTLVEYVDEEFIARHFGNSDGLLLKPEGVQGGVQYLGEDWDKYKDRYDAKFGDKGEQGKKARQHLIKFTNLVNNGSDEEFKNIIGDYLDVDAFLRFLSVNVLVANLDSILAMGHNYYIYLDSKTNKFVFFPWDLDLSFAGFPMGGSADQQMDLSLEQPYTGTNKLIARLLANETVKKSYHNHLQSLMKSSFNAEKLEPQIAAAEKLIRETLKAEPAQPSGPMGRPGGGMFGRSVPIREFLPRRLASVNAQLSGKAKGYVPQNRMRFGGPGGMGPGGPLGRPGAMEAPPLLKAMDSDKNQSLSSSELQTGGQQFFANADKDKNAILSLEELTNELENLIARADLMSPSFILARSLMRVADPNRDNQVSQDEWKASINKHFGVWDTNKNGLLDEPELASGLSKLMTQGFPQFEPIAPASGNEKPPQ